jgi:hypothetical protein
MTRNPTLGSARAEKSERRAKRIVAGAFALATMLLPLGAWGMDSTPGVTTDRAGNPLPLPPIPYLDSMRWMSWKPSAPIFKVDTLLLPAGAQPGVFRFPSEQERGLPRVS